MSDTPWPACWQPDTDWLIRPDVAERLDQTLLATHVPPVVLPIEVPGEGSAYLSCVDAAARSTRRFNQDDLLEKLLSPIETGNRVVAILGGPGTGKSHIIRWIQHSLPNDGRYVVRYVPKSQTSIAQVVERLLDGMQGPDVDDLRTKLALARKGDLSDPDRLSRRLAAEIGLVLQDYEHHAVVWQGQAAGLDPDKIAWLCSKECLPNLMRDIEPSRHLASEGGALWRIARQMLEGTREEHEDEGLRVEAADLDMRTSTSLADSNVPTQQFVRRLASEVSRAEAAAVINSVIDLAARSIMGITSNSLKQLVRQFRMDLKRRDCELVLLFEDLAIASGIRKDLIDVLETPATERGEESICNLRVAFAVTPAYWESSFPQTLTQRISQWESEAYSLDIPSAEARGIALGVYARNMNAARLGREAVEGMTASEAAAEIENACLSCPLKDECWKTFGTSDPDAQGDQYGLFPIRSERIEAMVDALATEGGLIRNRLVLRQIAGGVLRSRMGERRDFPSETLARALERSGDHISAEAQSAIRGLAGADESVEGRMIATWRITGQIEKPATRRRVFSILGYPNLAEIDSGSTSSNDRRKEDKKDEAKKAPDGPTSELQLHLNAVDAWANRTPLPAPAAQIVRETVNQLIGHAADLDDMALRPQSCLELIGHRSKTAGKLVSDTSIEIVRSQGGAGWGGNRSAPKKPLVTLEPKADALLVKSILRQHYLGRPEARLDASRQLARDHCIKDEARVAEFVEQLRSDIWSKVDKASAKLVGDAARALSLTGRLLGIDASSEPDPNWRRFLAEAPPESGLLLPEALRKEILDLHSSALADIASAIGRSQGGATTPTAIDPTVLTRDVQVSLSVLPDTGDTAQIRLVRRLVEQAKDLRNLAQTSFDCVNDLLCHDGELDDLLTVVKEVGVAADDAFRAGVVTSPNAVRETQTTHQSWAQNGVPPLSLLDLEACQTAAGASDDLQGVAKVLSMHALIARVGEIAQYARACSTWMAPALSVVRDRSDGSTGDQELGTPTALQNLIRDVEAASRLSNGGEA